MDAHTCGHDGQIRYRGRHKNRPVHPDLTKPCPTCRRAGRERATEALRAALAELRATLPQITDGSPKQIVWATSIRDDVFADPDRPGAEEYAFLGPVTIVGQPDGTVTYTHDDDLIELEQGIPAGEPITASQAREILGPMITTTSASWWINNR